MQIPRFSLRTALLATAYISLAMGSVNAALGSRAVLNSIGLNGIGSHSIAKNGCLLIAGAAAGAAIGLLYGRDYRGSVVGALIVGWFLFALQQ